MAASPETAKGPFSYEDMRHAWRSDQLNAKLDERDEAEGIDEASAKKIDAYIQRCRDLYRDPLINERTRHEYDKMWEELRAEGDVKKMQENVRFMSETIAQAKSYKEVFKKQLDEAVEKKWIGKKSRDNWWKRFESSNVLEWDRKKWIMDEFPKYRDGWKEVAKMRHEVRSLAKKLNVKENQIPELKGIYKIQEFLALQFDERTHKVSSAKAALLAYEKKQQGFHKYVKGELEIAVRSGYLHKSKVGEWLKRVMEAEDPHAFRTDILLPYMNNWEKVGKKFDQLHEDMKANTIPRGLRVLTKDAFLRLSYEQRESYLHEVELRMNEKEETDPTLDAFKKNIRHNLDTQDWDGAEEELQKARADYPEDPDLASMANFLRLHRPKTQTYTQAPAEQKESPDPGKTMNEMRAIVSQLPHDLQWLYIEAMKDGPQVFNRLLQIVYNRVWVYEHRYSNEQLDREHAESEFNKEKTEHYIENGHSRQLERNVLDGDTAHAAAIRDECEAPQVLYMRKMGRHAILQKVRTNKDNAKFGYWTTFVPADVPYALHRTIVKNYHYKLKSGLRELDKQGYAFSMSGSPEPKAEKIQPAPKEKEKAPMAETQYSMSA